MDSRAGLIAGGDSGPAIISGKPEASLLIRAVNHVDPDSAMPPNALNSPDTFGKISSAGWRPVPHGPPARRRTLRRKFPSIWKPAARHKPGSGSPQRQDIPVVRQAQWARDPVDHFILKPLEERWLRPAEPVSDAVWLRRASFAVTGLPPRPEDQQTLDRQAGPTDREHAVDQLLASPTSASVGRATGWT